MDWEMIIKTFATISVLLIGIIASALYDILLNVIEKKRKLEKEEKEPDISTKIKRISKTLDKSSIALSDLQMELEQKIQYVKELNAEANQAQSLLSLSRDQVKAITTMINKETQRENRANFWKSVLVNFVFFILGAVASYVISKYLV